jgi:hypothetical protein
MLRSPTHSPPQGTTLSFELNIEERSLVISSGTNTYKASLGDKLTTPLFICASSTLSVAKVCVGGGRGGGFGFCKQRTLSVLAGAPRFMFALTEHSVVM